MSGYSGGSGHNHRSILFLCISTDSLPEGESRPVDYKTGLMCHILLAVKNDYPQSNRNCGV